MTEDYRRSNPEMCELVQAQRSSVHIQGSVPAEESINQPEISSGLSVIIWIHQIGNLEAIKIQIQTVFTCLIAVFSKGGGAKTSSQGDERNAGIG